jgi:hypothetical protein
MQARIVLGWQRALWKGTFNNADLRVGESDTNVSYGLTSLSSFLSAHPFRVIFRASPRLSGDHRRCTDPFWRT